MKKIKAHRPGSRKRERSHHNMAAAALTDSAFRPRQTKDETKIIPRKRKHDDDLS